MNQKKHIYNNKVLLVLKNNEMNWIPPSNQTAQMRNEINEKIRKLGIKYYQIKNLFERLKLKRDFMFEVGKQLVDEFKDIKKGITLQAQQKRMKEGLLIWYTENFYTEIFTQNSTFINKFFIKNEIDNHKITKNTRKCILPNINAKIAKNCSVGGKKNSKEPQKKLFYSDVLYNEEIDSFDYSNITNNGDSMKFTSQTKNFDFDSFFI